MPVDFGRKPEYLGNPHGHCATAPLCQPYKC
uniref:Uncharacterized protein n=1 Tax=Anguilla anguilla TaxID=7936 RepID=A0A0E9RAT8_ANGAN